MRAAYAFLTAAVCIWQVLNVAMAQESAPEESMTPYALSPTQEQELSELLLLTPVQQKDRARELIRKYPNTQLARILQRLLDEYAAFGRIAALESEARQARTAGCREYWKSRCCPPPVWNPPVGRITNLTDEPILYEVRFTELHRTLWMGPYRLRAGTSYDAAYPFSVRYFDASGLHELAIWPGDSYTFTGEPLEGTLSLDRATLTPAASGSPASPPPVLRRQEGSPQ